MTRRRLQAFSLAAPLPFPHPSPTHHRPTCCLPPSPSPSPPATASPRASSLLTAVATKLALTTTQLAQLHDLSRLVLHANKTTNLTAVRTIDGLIARHLVDGLGLVPLLDDAAPRTIVDIGSGAGFPGLVLAIARPWSLSLVEASRKKSRFHEAAVAELGLHNVTPVWGRAEELGQDVFHRESYDVCVARAVAPMAVLAELTLPLVRVGGRLVAQKSVEREGPKAELEAAENAVRKMGGKFAGVDEAWTTEMIHEFMPEEVVSEDRLRAYVNVKKIRGTDQRYPRVSGTPKKNPL